MNTQALIPRSPHSLQLSSLKDWLDYAEIVCRTDVVPKEYRGKPADTLVAMQYGAEMGLPPLQALQSICVINGKPTVYGDALPGIAFATGECEDFNEDDTETVSQTGKGVCVIKRRGIPTPFQATYSIEQAKKAGLWNKTGPWTQHPARMLQMRARGWCVRAAFPDRLKGLQVREEIEDMEVLEAPTLLAMPRRISDTVKNVTPPGAGGPEQINGGAVTGEQPQESDKPACEFCQREMKLIPAGRTKASDKYPQGREYESFWTCPDGGEGKKHAKCTISDNDWQERLRQRQKREPGQEG